MATKWVDFRQIKKRIPIRDVLEHYGLLDRLRKGRTELVACCPIHGETNPKQFSVLMASLGELERV